MWPEMANGDTIYFDKNEEPKVGDIVVMFKRPELVKEGELQAMIKRLMTGIPPWVKFPYQDHPDFNVKAIIMVKAENPPRQYVVHCDQLCAIHKCIDHVPRSVEAERRAAR